MIPFAYPSFVLDIYRRQLQDLGIEMVDPRIAERYTDHPGARQMFARIGRWLARRPSAQPQPAFAGPAATART